MNVNEIIENFRNAKGAECFFISDKFKPTELIGELFQTEAYCENSSIENFSYSYNEINFVYEFKLTLKLIDGHICNYFGNFRYFEAGDMFIYTFLSKYDLNRLTELASAVGM